MSSGLGPESSPRAEPVKTSSPASPTHNHRQAKSIDVCSLIHGIHRASSDLSLRAECPTASRADPVQTVANLKLIDSTSVTSPRRARIFWKFWGRSSRLVDVARALFQIAPVTRD